MALYTVSGGVVTDAIGSDVLRNASMYVRTYV